MADGVTVVIATMIASKKMTSNSQGLSVLLIDVVSQVKPRAATISMISLIDPEKKGGFPY